MVVVANFVVSSFCVLNAYVLFPIVPWVRCEMVQDDSCFLFPHRCAVTLSCICFVWDTSASAHHVLR